MWCASLAVALGAALNAFTGSSADTDLWGHLRFGEAHFESGRLERSDPYAFTSGESWINHEWLSELIFFVVYRSGSDLGLLALKLVVGLATLALLVAATVRRGASPLVIAVVIPLAAFALTPGFMCRPQVFSYLLFAVTLALIRVDSPVRSKAVLVLPVVMLVWVNLHGGFLIGCAAVAVVVVAETVAAWLDHVNRGESASPTVSGGTANRDLRWLWAGAAGTAAATLVNPYGLELLRFLVRSLSLPRPIGEWGPLPLLDSSYPELKMMLILAAAAAAWLATRRELRPAEAAVLLLTAVAMLKHQRHAPFFVIAAAPLIADGSSRMWHAVSGRVERPRPSSTGTILATTGLLLIAVAELVTAIVAFSATGGRIYVDPELYPIQATDFLVRNKAAGRLLVPFEWGEYAIWHLFPACRVSIDGRFRTVYPESVLMDHYSAAVEPARWVDLMDRYHPDLVMIPRSPFVDDLARRSPAGWRTVYIDPLAAVLVRTDGTSSAVADAAAKRSLAPPAHPPSVFFP